MESAGAAQAGPASTVHSVSLSHTRTFIDTHFQQAYITHTYTRIHTKHFHIQYNHIQHPLK